MVPCRTHAVAKAHEKVPAARPKDPTDVFDELPPILLSDVVEASDVQDEIETPRLKVHVHEALDLEVYVLTFPCFPCPSVGDLDCLLRDVYPRDVEALFGKIKPIGPKAATSVQGPIALDHALFQELHQKVSGPSQIPRVWTFAATPVYIFPFLVVLLCQ